MKIVIETDGSGLGTTIYFNGIKQEKVAEFSLTAMATRNLKVQMVREIEGKPVAEWKIQNKTAIPRGSYQVIINYSTRFDKSMPLLLGVRGFSGVRIHSGNTAVNTEGCILVGDKVTENSIVGGTSKPAFNKLFAKMQLAQSNKEAIFLTIN
jgi:hypothetical protein